jgi:hypothetical protein
MSDLYGAGLMASFKADVIEKLALSTSVDKIGWTMVEYPGRCLP